jgi:hypothetical protein
VWLTVFAATNFNVAYFSVGFVIWDYLPLGKRHVRTKDCLTLYDHLEPFDSTREPTFSASKLLLCLFESSSAATMQLLTYTSFTNP